MAYETTTELRQYVEAEMGHQVSTSSDQDDIVSHLDRAHKMICGGGGILNTDDDGNRRNDETLFVWAKSKFPKIITLLEPLESESLTVTSNSTTATLASASTSNLTDWHIQVDGDQEVYRIASHTANSTGLTLDSVYVNSTDSSAAADIFKLVYSVGSNDILALSSPIRCTSDKAQSRYIKIVDENELRDRFPLADVTKEFPEYCSIIHEDDGTLYLQFSSYSEDLERLEVPYIPIPTTIDESSNDPIVPKHHRLCIAELACYFMLQRIDDDRASAHLAIARGLFDDLVEHNQNLLSSGDPDFGRVIPPWKPAGTLRPIDVQTDYEIG